jgi:hypothetical protein
MHKSKLILLYKSLNYSEKSLFKKWLKSPAHNKHTDVIQLFDCIASKKLLTKRTVEKKVLFKSIYPKESFNDLRLRHLMTIGVQVLENFVCFLEQKGSYFLQQKSLIKYCSNKNLEKFTWQHIEKSKQVQGKQVVKNSQFYYNQYELEYLILEENEKLKRVQTSNLQAITNNYSIAFIIETLKIACATLSYQNLNKKNSCEFPFLSKILDLLKEGQYKEVIGVQFYYYSYLSLAHPTQSIYFLQLKKLLFAQSEVLPIEEIKQIHIIAFNFCIKKLNNGEEDYVQEVFDLFKYGLEYHILVENNILSRFTYKNIITAALRLSKTIWTTGFIEQYTPRLEVQYQKNYQHFANAKLLFTQGNYQETSQLLNQVEYDDLFLNLDAKLMLLKIYYEEDKMDVLDAFLNSFYAYLQRKEIMGYHRENYKNIVKFTRKLAYLATFDKDGIQKLKTKIEQTNPLTEKIWLLNQVEKL